MWLGQKKGDLPKLNKGQCLKITDNKKKKVRERTVTQSLTQLWQYSLAVANIVHRNEQSNKALLLLKVRTDICLLKYLYKPENSVFKACYNEIMESNESPHEEQGLEDQFPS